MSENVEKVTFGDQQSQKSRRENNRQAIQEMAKSSCAKFGGLAIIDDHYVVVDKRKYDIVEKNNVRRMAE